MLARYFQQRRGESTRSASMIVGDIARFRARFQELVCKRWRTRQPKTIAKFDARQGELEDAFGVGRRPTQEMSTRDVRGVNEECFSRHRGPRQRTLKA